MTTIYKSIRYRPNPDTGKLEPYTADERFASDVQLTVIEQLDAQIVVHGLLAIGGNDAVRNWALIQPPGREPCFVHEDGGLSGTNGTPYPWCRGNPTKAHCIAAGTCRRNPNCGE